MAEMNRSPDKLGRASIAAMEPWFFWAREDSIGLDADTIAALNAGTPTEEQIARTRTLGIAAKNQLIGAVPCEPYISRRPS